MMLDSEDGSGSLDQSVVIFSRNSESGVEGGRVSSICASVVISRVLVALETDG